MAISYSPNKALAELAAGDAVGTWGTNVNSNMTIIDNAFGGQTQLTLSNANVTVNATQAQNCYFTLNGTLTANVTVTFPAVGSFYIIKNNTFGAYTITLVSGAGTQAVIVNGVTAFVMNDSVNMVTVSSTYKPYFRMESPSCVIPNNASTSVTNYQASSITFVDNIANISGGTISIGTTDAGIYTLTATCSCAGPNELVQIFIQKNGVSISGDSSAPSPTYPLYVSTSTTQRLIKNDVVNVVFFQTSAGGASDTTLVVPANNFSGVRVAL